MHFPTHTMTPLLALGLSSLLTTSAAPIPDDAAPVISAWRPVVEDGQASFLPAEFTRKLYQAFTLENGKGTLLDAVQVMTLTDSAGKPTKTATMEYVQIVDEGNIDWQAKAEIADDGEGQGKYEAGVVQGCSPEDDRAVCVGQSIASGTETTTVYSHGEYETFTPVTMTSPLGPLATYMNDKFGKKAA